MQESRTFYVKRNIFYGTINKLVIVLFPFIIKTIILWKLGEEYVGLGSLFTSILQVFSVAELGFSSAITFRMYKPIALHDNRKVCALLALYRKVYRIIGTTIFGIGISLMPFLPYLIKGNCPTDINIYLLYFIYLLNAVISYLAFAYKACLFSASQRQDVLSNIDTIITIVRGLIQIILLVVYKSYYAYIIWNPIFVLGYNLIIAYLSKKYYPQFICAGKLDKEEKQDLVKQIKGLVIGKLSTVTRNSFDSIVLSMFCGLVDVAIYGNYYYVLNAVSYMISNIVASLSASVGNSIALETAEKNYEDFKKINFIFSWIIGWLSICLLCLYQPFMSLWGKMTGRELVAPNITMLLFCIYFYVEQIGQARVVYSSASGIWWEFRFLQIGEMISNLCLNFILGYFWGMNGIIIATIITVLIFSNMGYAGKTIKISFQREPYEYFKLLIEYLIVTVITGGVTIFLCNLIKLQLIGALIVRGLICIVVPNIIFYFFTLCNKTHRKYFQSIRHLFIRQ